MDKNQFARTVSTIEVPINSGSQLSSFVDLGGMQLRGVLLPSVWTSCNLSFNVSPLPQVSPFFASYVLTDTTGVDIAIATDANEWLALLPYLFDAVPYVQLSCDVAQVSNVVVILVLEPIYQGIHG